MRAERTSRGRTAAAASCRKPIYTRRLFTHAACLTPPLILLLYHRHLVLLLLLLYAYGIRRRINRRAETTSDAKIIADKNEFSRRHPTTFLYFTPHIRIVRIVRTFYLSALSVNILRRARVCTYARRADARSIYYYRTVDEGARTHTRV